MFAAKNRVRVSRIVEELGPKLTPNKFTIVNIGRRLAKLKRDPWVDLGKVKQKLPEFGKPKRR